MAEVTIATLDGGSPDRRICVTLSASLQDEGTALRLRHESFSPDVGWFAQSVIDLSPDQVAQLRAALGHVSPSKIVRRPVASNPALRLA